MANISVILYALLFFCSSSSIATPAKPRQIPFSSKSYGPDGPWPAVSVKMGSQSQPLDLFPGGFWVSNILNTSVCDNTTLAPVCYGTAATLYNSAASTTFAMYPETGPTQNGSYGGPGDSGAFTLAEFGKVHWAFDTLKLDATQETIAFEVPSFDLMFITEGYQVLPDGSIYTMEVGNLTLGCPDFNQSWARADGTIINGTQLPNYLHTLGQTTSSSYGLHIGSASMGIPGSLWLGGYDQSRVLGTVSSQLYASNWLPIDLLDIGIGVAEEHSPFSFGTKSGYLAHKNASIGTALQVQVDPTIPYLYLPQSSCDAIAADLPLKFDSRFGLYLWQTNDPMYSEIISSPSILEFTFRLNSSNNANETMTINVPFALLNLTLTAPLVDQPTQYFPCRPSTKGKYYLGRAFCQAAFIGVNWMESTSHNGIWWLAQAPGPNTPSVPAETYIQQFDRYITASSNSWLDSWKTAWTPIGSTAGNSSGTAGTTGSNSNPTSLTGGSSSTPSSGSSLSTGAIAGLAIGTSIAAIAIIVLTIFLVRRRRVNASQSPTLSPGKWFSWGDEKARSGVRS
jgi:hypothetical protein